MSKPVTKYRHKKSGVIWEVVETCPITRVITLKHGLTLRDVGRFRMGKEYELIIPTFGDLASIEDTEPSKQEDTTSSKDTCPPMIDGEDKRRLHEAVRKNMGILHTRYRCPHESCYANEFKSIQAVKEHYVETHNEYVSHGRVAKTKYTFKE